MKVKIGFTIEPELHEVDRIRGMTKRSTFIEHLLRLGLKVYMEEANEQKKI